MPIFTLTKLLSLLQSSLATHSTSSLRAIDALRAIHALILKTTQPSCTSTSTLINAYSKLDLPNSALLLLQLTPTRSVLTWTSLISGSVQNGHFTSSLVHFLHMLRDSVLPNDYTFPCIFKASASLRMPRMGMQAHGLAVKLGLIHDVFVGSSAFDMYSKLGLKPYAKKLFDEMPVINLVTWNAYICNAVADGLLVDGINAFIELRRGGCGDAPDRITLCAFLNACSDGLYLKLGSELHGYVIRSGFEDDVSVVNGLVDFYGKCGEVDCAERVFHWMRKKNEVSWCSLMAVLVQNHKEEKSCLVFLQARKEGIKPNHFMFSSALAACAGTGGLVLGRSVQGLAVKACVDANVYVGSALVDMYGKCGNVEDAERVFNEIHERNLITWNSMIGAFAHEGQADQAIALFEEMVRSRVVPNHVTFVCVLSACSRGGKVKQGMDIFASIKSRYRIEPGPELYACAVDLLGRAGKVESAYEFINKMPFPPTISVWGSLLGACRVYRKPELGRIAAEKLFELDPEDSGNRVVLSNIYAAAGRWEEAAHVRRAIKDIGVKKGTGCSWIAVKNAIHVFQAKDTSHARNSEIQVMLDQLKRKMEEKGYVVDPYNALYDLEEEEKISEVWSHSEKIALAFGFLAIPPGVPIRINKNLRICGDCHSAFKLISGITGREIIVRDKSRFHRFREERCSCKNFW